MSCFEHNCCNVISPSDCTLLDARQQQDLWAHMENHSWDVSCCYAHLFRVADTLVSTKETLEDVIGRLSDFKRDNKNPFKALSLERGHFLSTAHMQISEEWPLLRTTTADLMDKSCTGAFKGRAKFAGPNAPQSEVLAALKADANSKPGAA